MMRLRLTAGAAAFVLTLAVSLTSLLAEPDAIEPARNRDPLAYGADLFEGWCSRCHAGAPGQASFAPALFGLFGRKAGSVAGFPYTPRIASLDLVWSAETLDGWLFALSSESPTSSFRHLGIQHPKDRAALVAYIATLAAH